MNLYDFNDLDDLPDDLAKRLSTSAVANPNVGVYAGIVKAACEAGLKIMSIGQIEAVAHRMGITVKTQQTIRTALNSGVKAGLLFKPSRQTYAHLEVGTQAENPLNGKAPVDVMDNASVELPVANNETPVATSADAVIDPLA